MTRIDATTGVMLRKLLVSVCLVIGSPGLYAEPVTYPVTTKSTHDARDAKTPKGRPEGELQRWQAIQSARSPRRIAALARSFQRDFPKSERVAEARELEAGASRVSYLIVDVGLSAEFFSATRGNANFDTSLLGAARGDADAAFALARAFREGKAGVPAIPRRQEQWLRIAAELGHAGASWELAQLANWNGRIAEAAHYENRAIALGYRPPPRLSNRDY